MNTLHPIMQHALAPHLALPRLSATHSSQCSKELGPVNYVSDHPADFLEAIVYRHLAITKHHWELP